MKKIKLLLCLAGAVLLMSGCSEEEEIAFQYEIPVDTMFEALDYEDNESYLRCFASPVVESYKNSDSYDEAVAESVINRIYEECDVEKASVNYKITDKRELSAEEIDNLGNGLQKGHKVKMAYSLNVKVTAVSIPDREDVFTCETEIIVGKLGESWYVCQSPELELDFIKSITP